jgi:hypothetical protein
MKNDTNNTTDNETAATATVIRLPRIPAERLRIWAARALTATSWLVTLGMLAGAAALGGFGLLAWIAFGNETLFAFGLLGGTILGAIGAVLLVRHIDDVARALRNGVATPANQ